MYTLIEKAFFLKKTPLFAELDLEMLLAIAEKLHEDEYDANEAVFTPGQIANRIYLIAQGIVQISDSAGELIKKLYAHDCFGDESLFNEETRRYGALCVTDTRFLTLSRSHLLSVISECPGVAVALLRMYAEALPCRCK